MKGFISLITVISITGVMVGVMALIVVLAVMTGFTEEFRDKILGINSHIVVQKFGAQIDDREQIEAAIKSIDGVVGVTPYIYSQTMITGGTGGTGAVLRGIDPSSAPTVLSINQHLKAGSLADLEKVVDEHDPDSRRPGVILGMDLAAQLRVGVGDRVRLLSLSGPLTPMGSIPKIKTCNVVGLFESGMYEYDSALAYVSLQTAQEFLEMGGEVNGIEVRIKDIYQASSLSETITSTLGPSYVSRDWIRTNKSLFSALQLEKTALSVIMTLVVLVAAFNIVSTLIMVVMEKNKDIAILKSMGATSASIMRIFIYEGLIIGFSGTFLGVVSGLGTCELLSRYKFIKLPDVYPISTLAVKVLPMDVTVISVSAILITFLATLYPSWQAAKLDPVVALRYE